MFDRYVEYVEFKQDVIIDNFNSVRSLHYLKHGFHIQKLFRRIIWYGGFEQKNIQNVPKHFYPLITIAYIPITPRLVLFFCPGPLIVIPYILNLQ